MVKYVPWSSYVDYMWCYFCFIMFDLGSQKKGRGHNSKKLDTQRSEMGKFWRRYKVLPHGAPLTKIQASESPEKLAFAGALRTSTVGWVKSLVPKRDHIKKTVNGCGSTPVIWWIHRLFVWFRPAHGILCWAWGVQRFSIFTYILHHAGILSFWG